MALTRQQKQKILEGLKDKINQQKIMIFVAVDGLKVKDLSELKKQLKEGNAEIKMVKKTLMNLTFKEKKIEINAKELKGELAIIFGMKDVLLPAKIAYRFSQSLPAGGENLKILGGFFENQIRPAEEIITLAQIPSTEQLSQSLVRAISAPLYKFVNVLQGNIKGLIYLLTQIKT